MFRLLAVFALVLPLFVDAHTTEIDNATTSFDSKNSTNKINNRFPRKWVADLFYETLTDFSVPKDVGSSACQRQTQMYMQHLKNDSYWAVQSKYF